MTYLALKKLETGTAARADVAELIFRVILRNDGRGITTTNNHGCTVLCSLDRGIEKSLRTSRKCRKLKYTRRTGARVSARTANCRRIDVPVPEDGLGLEDSLTEQFTALRPSIKCQPAVRNPFLVRNETGLEKLSKR